LQGSDFLFVVVLLHVSLRATTPQIINYPLLIINF